MSQDILSDESLPEQIARRLTHAILGGDYQPGARLPEPEIAARFGVSRGPVREAFHLLAREGLVQFRPRRGVIVTDLSVEETQEIYELRGLLFGHACRLAAARATDDELAGVRAALDALSAAVARDAELPDFMEARNALVVCVYMAARNRTLITETERLNRRALLHFAVFNRPERRRESVGLWRAVVDAIGARDGEAAAAAAVAMVRAAEREVIRLMAEREAARAATQPAPRISN
ncbi:GntR family transcriptional regulator [Phenylobacterium sp.]|uniref:GntR family transcriptional regulator n=1 Tax=Phenylobacterium sp. TaxID=1871053 RepID=UPI00301D8D91